MEPILFNLFEQCSDLNFKPFDITKYNCCDFEKNVDPNNNFYNNIRSPCKYYTEDQFVALKKANLVYRSFTSVLVDLEQTLTKLKIC